MASVKEKFKVSTTKVDEGVVYLHVIHEGETKQIKTNVKIGLDCWDAKQNKIKDAEKQHYVDEMISKLQSSIKFIEQRQDRYSVKDVVTSYEEYHKRGLFAFMEHVICNLKNLGQNRTAETYSTTLNSFRKFRNNNDIELNQIDGKLMKDYECYLKRNGAAPNTITFYMRVLRAMYNRAIEEGLTLQRMPFKHVSTTTEKTIKRAIALKEIKRIKECDLSQHPTLDFARDMFMFSFYTRGMSFVDMAYLRKKDLQNGVLSYRRRKTNQLLLIRWEECMEHIITKYSSSNLHSQYLLPIITQHDRDDRKQYKTAIFKVNNSLKKIANLVGITTNLTSYVARHSWASIAKSKYIPISVISEGLGHESESTTQIYLSSLDNRVVDAANSLILRDI